MATDMAEIENRVARLDAHGWRLGRLMLVMTTTQLALLLAAAGTWQWPNAWMYWATVVSFQLGFFTVMARHNPELLNERGKMFKPDTKGFDRILLRLYLAFSLALLAVAGIDYGRLQISDVPFAWSIAALVFATILAQISTWAMYSNRHFESTVRIQTDRDHRVVDAGPYRYVRHPGYVGALIAILALPVILGSWLAYFPAAVCFGAMVLRTYLEDRTLHRELDGYAAYAQRVRYRLIPGVW